MAGMFDFQMGEIKKRMKTVVSKERRGMSRIMDEVVILKFC